MSEMFGATPLLPPTHDNKKPDLRYGCSMCMKRFAIVRRSLIESVGAFPSAGHMSVRYRVCALRTQCCFVYSYTLRFVGKHLLRCLETCAARDTLGNIGTNTRSFEDACGVLSDACCCVFYMFDHRIARGFLFADCQLGSLLMCFARCLIAFRASICGLLWA